MNKFTRNALVTAIGATLVSTVAVSVQAETTNPFSVAELSSGYTLIAEGKCGEGKCGGKADAKTKSEGSCGESGKADAKTKSEGSCGERKSAGEAESKTKSEGKCGEGKCGGQG